MVTHWGPPVPYPGPVGGSVQASGWWSICLASCGRGTVRTLFPFALYKEQDSPPCAGKAKCRNELVAEAVTGLHNPVFGSPSLMVDFLGQGYKF